MNILFILIGISFVGILVVFWLLKNEDKPSLRDLGAPIPAVKPPVTPQIKRSSILAGLFAKFKKGKKSSGEEAIAQVPLPSVTDFAEKSFVVYQDKPEADPVAPQAALSAAEEKKIEQEIDLAAQIEEWKEKYERLDKLFNEKSAALTRSEESLQTEVNNRKEFNKLKDMLEKELREAKDKARNVQVELNVARSETDGNKKKINQLEEKIIKIEKAVLGKDEEIVDLSKRLKAATSALPVVAKTPDPNLPPQPAEPSSATAPAVPEVFVQPVVPPEPAAPGEPLPAEGTAEEGQTPVKEGEFLKLQPDILAAANPPDATTEPEIKKSEPKGPEDKPASEGQTNKQDEQKKE